RARLPRSALLVRDRHVPMDVGAGFGAVAARRDAVERPQPETAYRGVEPRSSPAHQRIADRKGPRRKHAFRSFTCPHRTGADPCPDRGSQPAAGRAGTPAGSHGSLPHAGAGRCQPRTADAGDAGVAAAARTAGPIRRTRRNRAPPPAAFTDPVGSPWWPDRTT